MIVIYTPAGEESRAYDAEGLTCGEADAVCRVMDMEWARVRQALRNHEPSALRAVAWVWEKRADPQLRYSHFDPPLKAVKARVDAEEIPELLRLVDSNPQFTEAMRAQARRECVDQAMDPDAARAAVEAYDNPPKEPAMTAEDPAEPSLSFAASTSS